MISAINTCITVAYGSGLVIFAIIVTVTYIVLAASCCINCHVLIFFVCVNLLCVARIYPIF